ncbi:VanZ family protein [Hallella mizrahii]|uniref:VanZ family protein n=1 Tax=Hallella mizrahii TaxID=2606637 RepID=A0A7K0KDV4_9BACT|nr:VanZ family protein [Hallella mizrahii]MST84103.1 VanZ family protein [Hallella mizrahii]
MYNILKSYPLSVLSVVVIWVLCLIPIPETPLSDIRMIDKWTHFVLYGGLCVVEWAEYGRQHARPLNRRAWIYTLLLPVIMGGLIEIVQATCTGGNRSGDIMDWAADNIGVVLGQLIGIPLALTLSKWRRGGQACENCRSEDPQ